RLHVRAAVNADHDWRKRPEQRPGRPIKQTANRHAIDGLDRKGLCARKLDLGRQSRRGGDHLMLAAGGDLEQVDSLRAIAGAPTVKDALPVWADREARNSAAWTDQLLRMAFRLGQPV